MAEISSPTGKRIIATQDTMRSYLVAAITCFESLGLFFRQISLKGFSKHKDRK